MITTITGTVCKGGEVFMSKLGNKTLRFSVAISRNGFQDMYNPTAKCDFVTVVVTMEKLMERMFKSIGGEQKFLQGGFKVSVSGCLTLETTFKSITLTQDEWAMFSALGKDSSKQKTSELFNMLKADTQNRVLKLNIPTKTLSMRADNFENHYDGAKANNFTSLLNDRKFDVPDMPQQPQQQVASTQPAQPKFQPQQQPQVPQFQQQVIQQPQVQPQMQQTQNDFMPFGSPYANSTNDFPNF